MLLSSACWICANVCGCIFLQNSIHMFMSWCLMSQAAAHDLFLRPFSGAVAVLADLCGGSSHSDLCRAQPVYQGSAILYTPSHPVLSGCPPAYPSCSMVGGDAACRQVLSPPPKKFSQFFPSSLHACLS